MAVAKDREILSRAAFEEQSYFLHKVENYKSETEYNVSAGESLEGSPKSPLVPSW